MNFSDKKIKNRPSNMLIYDTIFRSLILKLEWKSLQALKLSNSLTFPWFFSQISNSLTFPGSPGLLGCLPTLIRHYLSLRHDQIWNCIFCRLLKPYYFASFNVHLLKCYFIFESIIQTWTCKINLLTITFFSLEQLLTKFLKTKAKFSFYI